MPNSDKVLIHAMSGCTGHLLTYLVSVRVVTVVGLVFFFPEMDETRHCSIGCNRVHQTRPVPRCGE